MAKGKGHPLELVAGIAVAGVGGWWLWKNRASLEADVSSLLTPPATITTAPAATSTANTAPPSPIYISTGGEGNVTDQANAVVAALQAAGANIQPSVPLGPSVSGGNIIQTPYGPVETSVFEPAPTYYPGQAPQATTSAPTNTATTSAQAQLLSLFNAWQQNYNDLANAKGGNNPNAPASSIPAYQANMDSASNAMSRLIQANPGVDAGLNLSPWR